MENSNTKGMKRKQRIIDAAIEVIKEKSVEEATVREIAAKAGLTTGAIYHYYKNKDELFYDIMNNDIHFIYKLSEKRNDALKDPDVLLKEVQDGVRNRMSKVDEEKLHILLLSDVIAKNGEMKDKYKENYENIIARVSDMFYYTFGIKNEKCKKGIAAIFVAALDGISMQHSLGLIDEDPEEFIRIFNDFFTESVPAFLQAHYKQV